MYQSYFIPKNTVRPLSKILVNSSFNETRVAVLENDILNEIYIERFLDSSLVGNVFLGKVIRVLPGLQSAFVDIGMDKAAFLHVLDLMEVDRDKVGEKKIEHILYEGQKIIVQVIKDPIRNKGARLTTYLSFAGRYLVFLPYSEGINISQRLEDETTRNKLKERLENILPRSDSCYGYIIRTNAIEATDEDLLLDVNYLNQLWVDIQKTSKNQNISSLLQREIPIHIRILRDIAGDNTESIMVDSLVFYNEMMDFARIYTPSLLSKIHYATNMFNIFDVYNIEDEIKLSLQPKVNLKYGGYLIIETTESMTTIDVNTGGFVGNDDFEDTVLKTNIEACYNIARELRLRNIGGIIIIDFIDMIKDEYKEIVLQELTTALSLDRTKVIVNGFTKLGLVELTRKRTRESLKDILTEGCACCKSKGFTLTAISISYEILREVQRVVRRYQQLNGIKILAANNVIDVFLNENSESVSLLQEQMGLPIYLIEDSTYSQEEFDIVVV